MQYEYVPVLGAKKYLTGIIIPTRAEDIENLRAQYYGHASLAEFGLQAILEMENEIVPGEEAELESTIRDDETLLSFVRDKKLKNPEIANLDIRMKARRLSAQGLVHVQLYNKEDFYMGVPIRLKNKMI
jgi:hypothetical protein